MKFDARTLQILRNFAMINPSILFRPGNELSTISPMKSVMARATVSEGVPSQFAIYDLSRMIATLSLFDSPEIEVNDKFLTIAQGSRSVNYVFAEEEQIVVPPKSVKMPSADVSFDLSAETLAGTMKALSVLQQPEVAVIGKNGRILFATHNSRNPTGDVYSVDVGEKDVDNDFVMVFKAENMKILPGDYRVEISSKGLSHFVGTDVEYWIATESSSTFN